MKNKFFKKFKRFVRKQKMKIAASIVACCLFLINPIYPVYMLLLGCAALVYQSQLDKHRAQQITAERKSMTEAQKRDIADPRNEGFHQEPVKDYSSDEDYNSDGSSFSI